MKFFAGLAATIGAFIAATASMGCIMLLYDEAEMPSSLL